MDKCEEGRERAFKYVVLFAGLISLISIVSLSVTIPMAFSYVGRLDRRIQLDTAYCEETVSEITDEIVQFSYAASLIGNTTTEPLERGKRYADPYRSYFPTESPFPSGMDVQGSCCIPGPPGPPGLPGANGRPGIPGIPGEHGQPGRPPAAQCDIQAALSCPVCPAGPRGEPGRKGASGDRGPQGIPGNPGRPGPNGVPGSKGLRGIPGLRGQDGAEGDPGIDPPASVNIPCERGPLGEPGPPGPPGYSGEDGLDAPPGPAGRKGRPGYRGQPGIPGAVGPPGAPGAPGKAGGPGVCPTYCAIDGGSFYPDESVKINFKEA